MMRMKFPKLSCTVWCSNIGILQSPLKGLLNPNVLDDIATPPIHRATGKMRLHQGHEVCSACQRLNLILDHLVAKVTLLTNHC